MRFMRSIPLSLAACIFSLIGFTHCQNCDFEADYCGYTQYKNDNFDWSRKYGATGSSDTGPATDHTSLTAGFKVLTSQGNSNGSACVFPFTYQSKSYTGCVRGSLFRYWCATTGNYDKDGKWGYCVPAGYYAFIEASSPQKNGDKALLVSPTAAAGTYCLSFWYHMYGPHIDTLNVYVNTSKASGGNSSNGLGNPIWSERYTKGNQWLTHNFTLVQADSFQLVFEAIRGKDYKGDISIDDISLGKGACAAPTSGVCDFEKDTCGFTQETGSDDFDWTRDFGGTRTRGTGPSIDHTLGTNAGYYFYVEASGKKAASKGRLRKSYTGLDGKGSCMTFWYHMFGQDTGLLNVYFLNQATDPLGKPAWTMSGEQGNIWLKGEATISNTSTIAVFEGIIGNSYRSDMAIDDVSVAPGICSTPGECNFQNGLCTWSNRADQDDFDWITGSGATASSFTGPSADHNGDISGQYLFIETSSPRKTDDKARLTSMLFNASNAKCLTFWYHMYGTGIGSLNIYQNASNAETLVWKLSGDKGNKWKNGQIQIGSSSSPYEIIFEGVRGIGYTGDIAIDDFKVKVGGCSIVPADADPNPGSMSTTPKPTPTTVAPTTKPTGGGVFDCTFEVDLCSWQQEIGKDHLNWTRVQGTTPSFGTGPSKDHTLGTKYGHYIYLEVSQQTMNKTAWLISPSLPGTNIKSKCLKFYYHMYGSSINSLNVYSRVVGGSMGKPIWSMYGTQGDNWRLALVTLSARSHFQVILEAVVGSTYRGDIAVDDVSVLDGNCPKVSSTCTFEEPNLCGYTDDASSDVKFKWKQGAGSSITPGTGPAVDHTTNSAAGKYMFASQANRLPREKARIVSPSNPATPGGSCLQFWYYLYGNDVGQLRVYVKSGVLPGNPVWSESGNKGKVWKIVQQTVKSTTAYDILFEAVVGNGVNGYISIDDVTLTAGPCTPPGSCDFENGLCTYTNSRKDDFDWIRMTGETPSTSTGPKVDHTTGFGNGTYLYIESSNPQAPGEKARLISEQFNNLGTTPRCLTFWYHMFGNDIGSLHIYKLASNKQEKLLWNLTGQQQLSKDDAWRFARIPVKEDTDHVIIFEGVIGSSYQGDIAIDDIQFVSLKCNLEPSTADPNQVVTTPKPPTTYPRTNPTTIPPGVLNCNFEKDLCSYTHDGSAHFNFTREQGYTGSIGTGPSFDHTIGSGAVSATGPGSLQHSSGKCVHVDQGAFTKPNNDHKIVVYTGCGQSRLQFQLTPDNCLVFTKYSMYVRPAGSSISEGASVGVANSCGSDKWQITSKGSLKHIPSGKCLNPQNNVANPPDNTFLVISKTCDTLVQQFTFVPTLGHYMFIETSYPRKPNDTARLISPAVTKKGQCLNFWYHMYGAHVNQLNVYLMDGSNKGRPIWSKYGTHGDVWKQAHVLMTKDTPYQIVIEAVSGDGYQGDIAIDDIEVNGNCPPPVECSFEETSPALCGYVNLRNDNFDWKRATGKTASIGTGPASDHTYGNAQGYYMYIETSGRYQKGFKALLQSPQYPSASRTNGKCLQFWYHMYGNSIGSLKVFIQVGTSLPKLAAFQKSTNQGNKWLLGQVSITSTTPYKVVFEGKRGSSFTGDIAIDDVRMLDGVCNNPASCDFENDRCTWTNTENEDDFDWIIGYGSTPSSGTGPAVDHSIGNAIGKYIYMEASLPQQPGNRTRLVSEQFPPMLKGVKYCLRFWYHMAGGDIGTLNLYTKSGPGSTREKVVWSLSGNQGVKWLEATAPIAYYGYPFQMVFEGVVGASYKGDIALDDISYGAGGCPVRPSEAVPRPPTTQPPPTPKPTTVGPGGYGCNFESGFCYYKNDPTADFNWTRHSGATSSTDTGPSADHTKGTVNGTYVFIETSYPQKQGNVARLVSPVVPADANTGGHCLKFWYHMYGPHIEALRVLTRSGSLTSAPVWARTGNNGNTWKQALVQLSHNVDYQILFEGVRGVGFNGDISLDDIDLTSGDCPISKECDFEHGKCGYTDDTTDDFDWTRQKGATPSLGTGPPTDHTLQTDQGYYMYTEMSLPVRSGQKAQFVSPVIKTTSPMCLQFWYHMKGYNMGTLRVYLRFSAVGATVPNQIFWKDGNHGDEWKIARASMSGGAGRQIVFEGTRGNGYAGDIAIDDIQMLDGFCPPPGNCNFETGSCTWVNPKKSDDFDWILGSGSTTSSLTGPDVDHTTQSAGGKYAFIETSSPRKQGDRAWLASETFGATSVNGKCIKFWYHMKGGDIGTLTVIVLGKNSTEYKIWQQSGQQGDKWNYAQAPIRSNDDYQIVFEGVRGNGYSGDIAIDDIEFTSFSCTNFPKNSVPPNPTTVAPTTIPTTTPFKPAPSRWDCNFTTDKCGWFDDKTAVFNWTRHQGSTGSTSTGPTSDHTTGAVGGWYIFIETSYPRVPNDTARLVSSNIPSSNQKCLSFWYHMYGDHVDNLTIYIKTRTNGMLTVWRKQGTQGDRWRHGTVDITSNTQFQLVFEGTRGMSYRGDIAIDDINVFNGRCPPQAECTFEDPKLCGWSNTKNGDDFDWSRGSSASQKGSNKFSDHTYGSDIGFYMYLNSYNKLRGHKAWLQSAEYSPTAGSCLQFWYHMSGTYIGTLNVLIHQNGNVTKPLWGLTGSQGYVWRIAQVTITSKTKHRVVFEGVIGAPYYSFIAIDDVMISPGACPRPGDCTFERGPCTYVNHLYGDNFDWLITSGATSSQFTGPKTDHSTQLATGKYMFLEASYPRMPQEKAALESEVMPSPTAKGKCLQFWYHMYGAHVGTLDVFMAINQVSYSITWSLSDDQGDKWQLAQVPMMSRGRPMQVTFEGIRGYGYKGDIAIDDITVTDFQGNCPVQPAAAMPFGCNFELDTCRWTQTKDDDFDWTRHKGNTGSLQTGPSADHTTYTKSGYYMYIETSSPRKQNDTARLMSPVLRGNGTKLIYCISFYYHMYGPHVDSLTVYTKSKGKYGPVLWKRSGTKGTRWNYGEISVTFTDDTQVVFEGTRGTNYKGDIAIDDVDLEYGDCPSSGLCTFEGSNLCGYYQDKTDQFDWTRSSGNTPSSRTGPKFDHTYGTKFGHYLFIETSSNRQGDKARLLSPYYYNRGQRCVQFYYHMYGSSIGTLNVYSKYGRYQFKQLTLTGNRNNTWHFGQVDIKQPYNFQVVFEAVKGASYTGDIAIDDIRIKDGSCPAPGDCDFEEDNFCTWTNNPTDDTFDWIMGQGGTQSLFTGPKIDHTKKSADGHYAFIETSSPRVQGDKAYLESILFQPTTSAGQCFNFWYHMYGSSIGTLHIYMSVVNGVTVVSKKLLWELRGNQGTKWKAASIPLSSTTTYKIVIEGIRGSGYRGDIAVDDITFTIGQCQFQPLGAVPPGKTTPAPTAPTTPTRGPTAGNTGFDCNFEKGYCTYQFNHTGNSFIWKRHLGGTTSSGTGPKTDHTLGTGKGYYVYIETSSPAKENDTAILRSDDIPTMSSGQKCLSFWYHMFGPHVNRFSVYFKVGSVETLLWERRGTQGDAWKRGLIQMPASTSTGNIEFIGVRGKSYRGDIALDDISLLSGACPPPAECTFEQATSGGQSICSWTQDNKDKFDWTRAKGSTPSVRTGPKTDHTLGSPLGYYMYIETSSPRKEYDNAKLVSGTYPQTTGKCFRFWYHMKGTSIGTLSLYQLEQSTSNLKWRRNGNQADQWIPAYVDLKSQNGYQLVFEGVVGKSYSGDIAIDDLLMVDGSCPAPGDCDFEAFGMCNYFHTTEEDDFDWLRGNGDTTSYLTGPKKDHTLKSSSGHYMYIEASSPQKRGDKARLISEQFPATARNSRCVTFYFHMFGTSIGTMNILVKTGKGNQSETVIWSNSGNHGQQWIMGQAPIASDSPYRIVFEGVVGKSYQGDIALDDVVFTNFRCTHVPANAAPPTVAPTTLTPSDSNCTFETGICRWRQLTTDDYDWKRNKDNTGSVGTGPLGDHTTGKGYYVYIETSSPTKPNDTAIIESPPIKPKLSLICFTFWFHMHGAHVNQLNAYYKIGSSTPKKMWSRTGTQGNRWRYAQITIRTYRTFTVQLEGIRGPDYQGDIAIDDVVVINGRCPVAPHCDFEDDNLCNWRNVGGDDFDWKRGSDGTPSLGTGPKTDHTSGTSIGNFMYIESSYPRKKGQKAYLYSPFIRKNFEKCLNFYYHMYGNHIGQLNVYLDTKLGSPIWNRTGDQGNFWQHGRVTVKGAIRSRVVFEGVIGSSYKGDIALDDVWFDDTPCPPPGSCNFEGDGFCTWMNVPNGNKTKQDNFDWELQSGSTPSSQTGPIYDHTLGTGLGTYMFIEVSGWNRAVGEVARIESEIIPASAAKCMSYWYHMFGSQVGAFNIYSSINGIETLVQTINGSQGNNWNEGEVTLASYAPFKIILEGVRGPGYQGDIAIDDIYFKDGTCVSLCSSVAPLGRVKCGTTGISQSSCEASGCCYDDSLPGMTTCFFHPRSCSAILPTERQRCGYTNIPQSACTGQGCCYDTTGSGGIRCYHSKATAPVTTPAPPPTTPAPSKFDCSFESGLCEFKNTKDDEVDWKRISGTTASLGTGPRYDHTLNNKDGYYVYLETSTGKENDTANLASPQIDFNSGGDKVCVRFYYHMYGAHVDTLKVFVKRSSTMPASPTWVKQGTHGDKWRLAQIEIARLPIFSVVFKASRGTSYQGDIALDDIGFVNQPCPPLSECEFESDSICGYTQDSSDDFDWMRSKKNTTSRKTGPPTDHTYGTKMGHFMYIEASYPRQPGDRARLESPAYPGTIGGKCVQFYYHMYGVAMGTLRVLLRKGGVLDTNPIWSMKGDQGNQWTRATFSVITPQAWKIVFEGIRGSSFTSDAAIDDVSILDGACPPRGACDFENGMCDYTNPTGDDFDWVRNSGKTSSVNTGPSIDHTMGTEFGSYMYIETSSPRKPNDYAVMYSEFFQVNPNFKWCMTFWYHMYGPSVGHLAVGARYKAPSAKKFRFRQFWVQSGNHGNLWHSQQVQLSSSYDFQIYFTASVGNSVGSYQGDIAIDDINVSLGKCPVPTPTPAPNPCAVKCKSGQCVPQTKICDFFPDCGKDDDSDEINCGACNFEKGYCNWTDTSKGTFDWNRGQGATGTVNTGPATDHTLDTAQGWYAYVEASRGTSYSLATLSSPVLRQAYTSCKLNFWYHMYGSGIGDLRVYIKTGTRLTLLFEKNGNQGKQWVEGFAYISRRSQPYQLLIEAERSYSVRGDIAIDDIKLVGCELPPPAKYCSSYRYRCVNTRACLSYDQVCDFVDDCGDRQDEANCPSSEYPYKCHFEYSMCSFKQLTDDQFNFTRASGSTATKGTGPMFDHTRGTNTGYYLYAEASYPRKPGDKARIASGLFAASPNYGCSMRMFYHMYGKDIGLLNVYIRNCDGCQGRKVFTRNGTVGNYWAKAVIRLRSSSVFQVVIEAVRGNDYTGDIAVDDITFKGCRYGRGTIPPLTTTAAPPTTSPPCSKNKFYCQADRTCIPMVQYCDLNKDCKDGSDEATCGPCTFENGTCGYSDASTGSFVWAKANAPVDDTGLGPTDDHTNTSGNGCDDQNKQCPYWAKIGECKKNPGYMLVKCKKSCNVCPGTFMVIKQAQSSISPGTLISSGLPATGPSCIVQFYYNMNTTGSAISVNKNSKVRTWFATATETTNNKWKKFEVGMGGMRQGWQLLFNGLQQYTAIDDIAFVNCALPPKRQGQCPRSQVSCSNGACVDPDRMCDFANDCGDGSDEYYRVCYKYPERCSFRSTICNWHQDSDDNFDWNLGKGAQDETANRPGADHTKSGRIHGFIYVDTNTKDIQPEDKARLSSVVFRSAPASKNCRMRFFYYLSGKDNTNILNVYTKTSAAPSAPMKSLFTMTGDKGFRWNRQDIPISSNDNFMVIIEAVRGKTGKGILALDDVSFTPGCTPDFSATLQPQPPTVTPPPGCNPGQIKCASSTLCVSANYVCDFKKDCPDGSDESQCESSCDFEKSTCGWKNARIGDRMDWIRHQGKTFSNGTGPSIDHTKGTSEGYYAYLEAHQGGRYGRYPNAHLISPVYLRGSYNCKLNFWYNMYHFKQSRYNNVQLNILYRRNGKDTKIWSSSRSTGDKWKAGLAALPNCPTDFQIVFEGLHYWNARTDPAIDDLKFDCAEGQPPSNCGNQFQCAVTRQCVDRNTICDLDRNCCDGSDEDEAQCSGYKRTTFETGFGDWTQLKTDVFDFTSMSGATGSYGTGPYTDHTLQEEHGKYIFIEASQPRKMNDTAQIASPTIAGQGSRAKRATNDCTMRFFYHMSGSHIGSLSVYIATQYGVPFKTVYTTSTKSSGWKRAVVPLSNNANFQVIIEGKVGSGYQGDISIDDISFTPGCNFNGNLLPGQPTPPPIDPCLPGFQCRKEKVCIPQVQVCDSTPDCSDGSDEDSNICGNPCSFENRWCGWKNAHDDTYDWQLLAGKTASQFTGPSTDATGNKTRMYAYLETSKRQYKKTAVLTSPTYGGSYADCVFKFYYHMYGSQVGTLTLDLLDGNGTRTRLWGARGNQGSKWNNAMVSIGRRNQIFNLTFTGSIGTGPRGDLALDELSLQNCSRPQSCTDYVGKHICGNGNCIPSYKICDAIDDCGDGSDELATTTCAGYILCNFENDDTCKWTQARDDDFDWTKNSGRTPSVNTGPNRDHTYGTSDGHYMYSEVSGIKKSSKARLVSFTLLASKGSRCKMGMFYHMWGRSVGTLRVYTKKVGSTTMDLVFNRTGNQMDIWRRQEIDLSTVDKSFAVVIEAERGVSYSGDIAIDDVTFSPDCRTNGSRPVFPTRPPGCPGQFMCLSDSLCISNDKRCDKANDCQDGSDEQGCPGSGTSTGSRTGLKNSGVIASIVVGALVVLLIIILVAYIVMKRRKEKKLHLFSVFYDPTKQQNGPEGKAAKPQLSIKGEGVSNPVYDEGQVGDFTMGDLDTNMFTEDAFTVPVSGE